MLLAGWISALAQSVPAETDKTLQAVVVKEKAEAPEGKDRLRAITTSLGKGQQALKSTSGISFLAADRSARAASAH